MNLLFIVGMCLLALALMRFANKPLYAFVLAALVIVLIVDQAEARQRGFLRGRLRGTVSRAAEAPRRVVNRTAEIVRGCVGGNCQRSFDDSAVYRRNAVLPFTIDPGAPCDNPNCTCENCPGDGCNCGVKAKSDLYVSPDPEDAADVDETQQRAIAAVNQYRAKHGKPPLRADGVLMRLARMRVGVFHHNHPRFGWMRDHAQQYGYAATDNLEESHGWEMSPEEAVEGWATSTVGHDKQMLGLILVNGRWCDEQFDRIGVAKQGSKWIAVFGRKS